MLQNDHYTYRVTWSEEDGEYIGLCAEFPSLSWLAAEPEAALSGYPPSGCRGRGGFTKRIANPFQSLWPRKNTVAVSWSEYPLNFTVSWLWKRQNQASA